MKIIEPSVETWTQEAGVQGLYDHIERCARVCYRSENKGNVTSEEFVNSLIKRGDMRPLEFGTIRFEAKTLPLREIDVHASPYVRHSLNYAGEVDCVVTNLRWLVEHVDEWECWLKKYGYWKDDFQPSKLRPTLHWHISRGIADEFRTHVSLSSLMESTRFVNYEKKGLEFVYPTWCVGDGTFTDTLDLLERRYNQMIKEGMQPQQAREVLPLCTATHLVQCGFKSAWLNFFKQRTNKSAHPDAQRIAKRAEWLLGL